MIFQFNQLYSILYTIQHSHPNIYSYWKIYLDELKQTNQYNILHLKQSIEVLVQNSKYIKDFNVNTIVTLQLLSLLN